MSIRAFAGTALAAAVSFMFFTGPARSAATLAVSGPYTLTQAMVNDDLAVWQLVAGRPLAPTDRQAVTAVDIDLFRRDPAWLTASVRQAHKALPGLRRADPVTLAGLRLNNLVALYCTPQAQHLSSRDAAQMKTVISHYLPVVGVDVAGKAVVTQRDIDAWVSATCFVITQAHLPAPTASYRDNLVRLARNPSTLGGSVEPKVAGMEHNWAAFQLVWPHLNTMQRQSALGQYLPKVRQAAARGGSLSLASVVALQAGQNAAEEYPYALDPRLAAYKFRMEMRMGRFQQNMMNYNMQNMLRSQENYQRSLRGEGPNPAPIPVPVP